MECAAPEGEQAQAVLRGLEMAHWITINETGAARRGLLGGNGP
jgi:hypothetical protein